MADNRDSVRRDASDPLLVYDIETNLPIGQIINLSDRGFKLMSEEQTEVSKIYHCRMSIPENMAEKNEVKFFAESRWCNRNEETTWYDSGFYMRKIEPSDLKIIQSVKRKWMIDLSNKINDCKTDKKDEKDEKNEGKGFLSKLFS